MPNKPTTPAPSKPAIPAFDPVPLKARHDGWTPEKQIGFIEALAECGCVEDAARRVGMSKQSAYNLRSRLEAHTFRLAWRFASEHGAQALGEAAWSRALHGTVTPIFYKGEQVGERRHFDERLTMFLLRHRDPVRFGKWIEKADRAEENKQASVILSKLLNVLCDQLHGEKTTLADFGLVDCAADQDIDDIEEENDEDEDDDEDFAPAKAVHIPRKRKGANIYRPHPHEIKSEAIEAPTAAPSTPGDGDAPDAISGGTYPSTSSTLASSDHLPGWRDGEAEKAKAVRDSFEARNLERRQRLPRVTRFGPPAHLPPWM